MVAPFHEPMVSPVIVGRAAHLAFFDRILDDSRAGRGHTLLLSGEPGIGKSRLISEGKRRAQHLGFTALEGSCFETDRSLPYAPVADLLRDHLSECPPEGLAGRLGPGAAELVQVLPELAGRLPGLSAPVTFEPGQERRRLFQAVAQLVNGLTRRGPVLMLFEDVHWSDELSLQLLLDLARRVSRQPVLLLLTYRSDEISPGLSELLFELDRGRLASELVLSPLEPAEVEEMVRAILELDRPPRPEFLTDLYALTEGNPFFVEEVLRSLMHTGEIFHLRSGWNRRPTGALPIPRSVHESVRRRSAGLTTRAGEALVLAAVAGRRFDVRLLRELLEADEQELVGVIKELMGAQLVVETSADHFAFRHALTREAIESGLLARERRRLHRIVGEGLERLHAGALEAHVSDLARHFGEAGVWEKVLHYARKAGERARALYAPHVAAEQLTLALEAAAHLGQPADLHLHRSRGLAYETLGEFDRALADLEAALALARRGGDRRAQWQGLIDLGLLWAARDYARTGDCYREALTLARTDDRELLAQSLNWLGNWHLNVAQPKEGLRCHGEALAIFEELDDRRGLAETHDLLGLAANMEDNLVESVSHFRRAITLFRELDDRQRLCSSLSLLANTLGDRIFHDVASHPGAPPEEAVEHAKEALSLAREIGWRSGEAYALINLACCLGSRGEYGLGLPAGREALAVAEEIGHVEWTAGAHCALGAIHRDLLVADRTREHLERALTLAREAGSRHWVGCAAGLLASACLMERQPDAAESALAATGSSDLPARTTPDRLCWAARAELAIQRGDPRGALAIVDELLSSSPGGGVIPRLSKLRGEALVALGRREEAEEALLEARRFAAVEGVRPLLWRVDVSLGRLYRDWRRHADAGQAFSSARTVVAALAAGVSDDDLRARFLEESGKLIPSPLPLTERQAAKVAFGGLTGREREVAALIASGKANREIADALVLSDRTVEGHVANILAKLSFSTRAQIAAWAVEKGLARGGR